jgi:hypothetical protein
MSESKHTPGPWAIEDDDDVVPGVPCIPVAPAAGVRRVCEVSSTLIEERDEFMLTDEDRANARLIAAAPFLLKQAQDLLNSIDSEVTRLKLAGLRAAVAIATGAAP